MVYPSSLTFQRTPGLPLSLLVVVDTKPYIKAISVQLRNSQSRGGVRQAASHGKLNLENVLVEVC